MESFTHSKQAVFDTKFSNEFFSFSENETKATFKNASNNNLYADYSSFPVARTEQLFKSKFAIEFTMSNYGWVGLGSNEIKNDGFPGYTSEGFMICVDGRMYHNKSQISSNPMNFANTKASLIFDPSVDLLQIFVNGKYYDFCAKFPKEAYFVISISTGNSVKLHILNHNEKEISNPSNSSNVAILEEKIVTLEKSLANLESKFSEMSKNVKVL